MENNKEAIPANESVTTTSLSTDIRELNDIIQKESAFLDLLNLEIKKVIVGQQHMIDSLMIGLLSNGEMELSLALKYLTGQVMGAFIGALIIYFHYLPHWDKTDDKKTKLGVFATSPAVDSKWSNLLSETVGTFALLFGLMFIGTNNFAEGLNPIVVGSLVCAIGISLGGTTGYAINPVRDFIPRLAHSILPIKGKGDSNWSYSWIPVLGPILGGVLGVNVYEFLFNNSMSNTFIISSVLFLILIVLTFIENKD